MSESAQPDGECAQEVSHVICHVTSVPCMGGSGSDPVQHRKRSQLDPNWTGPQRGLGFRPSAQTEPGSGSGSGEYGLRTGPNRTVATISAFMSEVVPSAATFASLSACLFPSIFTCPAVQCSVSEYLAVPLVFRTLEAAVRKLSAK